jgi:hypothetical protein
MFFSTDLIKKQPSAKDFLPNSTPIYMLPEGGVDVPACKFVPFGPEPRNCGGLK